MKHYCDLAFNFNLSVFFCVSNSADAPSSNKQKKFSPNPIRVLKKLCAREVNGPETAVEMGKKIIKMATKSKVQKFFFFFC